MQRECSVTKYYFDNSATTRVSDTVLQAMLPYFQKVYGNPSSIYTLGREARDGYIHAVHQTAVALGADDSEIYFTSGGSESDTWALKSGASYMAQKGKKHIISASFEHPAILKNLQKLEQQGFKITFVNPESNGIIRPESIKEAIREDTGLISIMFVNNETGMIQPIEQIGALCGDKNILFHTDAVQAIGNVAVDVKKLHIDLLSASGHKIHGPKGVGILYMKKGLWLDPLIAGGGQEKGRRAGTENIPGIVGFGTAIQEATEMLEEKEKHLKPLQRSIYEAFRNEEGCTLVGKLENRICTNINLCVQGVEAKKIVYALDNDFGIAISSVSDCGCKESRPSHVLMSMGYDEEEAKSSIRITMSKNTTEKEVQILINALRRTIKKLRRMPNEDK